MVERMLADGNVGKRDVDLFLSIRPRYKLLDRLRKDMQLDESRMPTVLRRCRQYRRRRPFPS